MVTKPITGKMAEALEFRQSVGIQDSAPWAISSAVEAGMGDGILVLG